VGDIYDGLPCVESSFYAVGIKNPDQISGRIQSSYLRLGPSGTGIDLPRATSWKEIVAQDRVDGVEAVFPIHFFAFAVGASVVGNADFVNAAARFC
jgi:hypothetical protein